MRKTRVNINILTVKSKESIQIAWRKNLGATWYQNSLTKHFDGKYMPSHNQTFDIVIVGGGIAGLTLLLQVTNAGANALLVESDEVGAGASGKNGGFCSPGWSQDYTSLLQYFDNKLVKELDRIASIGVEWVRNKCRQVGYEGTDYQDGIVSCYLYGSEEKIKNSINKHNKLFETNDLFLSKAELEKIIVSDRYRFGIKKSNAFHFHPLNFIKSLANENAQKGAKISEKAQLLHYEKYGKKFKLKVKFSTVLKDIFADRIVFATGGYAGSEIKDLRKYWLPIKTFIGVTERIDKKLFEVFRKHYGISDNRRAGNYFRIVDGNRISWGRGISAISNYSDAQIRDHVADDIKFFFPQLGKLSIDYVWSGKMAYARHMMPYVGPVNVGCDNGLFALTGFGGHGMNTAPGSAIALGEYLINGKESIQCFEIFKRVWNGGILGPYIAEGKYYYLKLRDHIEQIRRG